MARGMVDESGRAESIDVPADSAASLHPER